GSFSYCVQDANGTACGTLPPPLSGGAPVSPLEVALRSIGFLGLAIAFGVGIMANFMWIPAGKDPDARGSRAYGVAFPVLLNVGRIASFGFIVSMAGLFALATGLEGNSAAEALKASSYVQSVAVRLALGIGLFDFLSRAFAQSRGGNPEKVAWSMLADMFAALGEGWIVLDVLLIGPLDASVTSPHRWVILAKVGHFAPMLALGAYNRYRLVPKTAESERPTEAVRRIVGNVRFETSLGIAVLVL